MLRFQYDPTVGLKVMYINIKFYIIKKKFFISCQIIISAQKL